MSERGVVFRCTQCGQEQKILTPDADREWVDMWRQLMVGRGPMYPGPQPADDAQTVIGKSACCRAQITDELFGYPAEPDLDPDDAREDERKPPFAHG
jgi:hypothetical protein